MAASRRDLSVQIHLDSSGSQFRVDFVSQIEHTDPDTNIPFARKEMTSLEWRDMTPQQQADGLAFLASLRGDRDSRFPLVRPSP